MTIVQERGGVLTNLEVKLLLEEQQSRRIRDEQAMPLPGARRGQAGAAAWQSQQHAALISEQVSTYLETTSCVRQTRESITAFMGAIERFQLTTAEALSLVNTQPQSVVEIHLLVEECEERLSSDDVLALLRLCKTLSPEAVGSDAST